MGGERRPVSVVFVDDLEAFTVAGGRSARCWLLLLLLLPLQLLLLLAELRLQSCALALVVVFDAATHGAGGGLPFRQLAVLLSSRRAALSAEPGARLLLGRGRAADLLLQSAPRWSRRRRRRWIVWSRGKALRSALAPVGG